MLAAAALIVLLVTTANPGPSLVNDTRASALSSWALGTQGELALPEPWPASRNYWGVTTPDGRVHVNRFPGVALWASPAYAVHHLVAPTPPPAHPFLVDLRPAAWTAAVTVAAAGGVLYAVLRRVVPRPWAGAGAGVLVLGTGLWSVAADSLWPHGPAVLALATLLLAWQRGRRGDPLLAAGAAALTVLVRPHLAVATVLVGADALRRGAERRVGVATLVGTAAGLALLVLYTRHVFGTWTPTAGYDVAAHLGGLATNSPWQTVRAFTLALVGAERGALLWWPVVGAGAVLAAVRWRDLPAWTVASALAGLAYLVVQVRAVGHLGGADFFGPRISLEPLVLAAPALVVGAHAAATMPGRAWRRGIATAVLTVTAAGSVGLHAFGAVARSTSPQQLERWERIDDTVRRDFGDLQLGDVDLRTGPPGG